MNRELWLLRHGHAEQSGYENDPARQLTVRGIQEARYIGKWLKSLGLLPDEIWTSPAVRAFDTTKQVIDVLAWSGRIKKDNRLYFQGKEIIKVLLADITAKRVLLVGHNPDFEKLLFYLVGKDNLPATTELMPTATLARLQMPDEWGELPIACATLVTIQFPPLALTS